MAKKLFVLLLLSVLPVVIAGCVPREITVRYSGQVNRGVFVETNLYRGVGATEWENTILERYMEKVFENEYMELHFGRFFDIAVRDKYTGRIFFSGRALYPEDGSEVNNITMIEAASQLFVEYFNQHRHLTRRTTFPHSFENPEIEQVVAEIHDDHVRVVYTIGTRPGQHIIIPAMRPETFNYLRDKGRDLVAEGEITQSEFRRFTDAYRRIVLSTLSESSLAELHERFANLDEFDTIFLFDVTTTERVRSMITTVFMAMGVDDYFIEAEVYAMGDAGEIEEEHEYVVIPIIYRFDVRDLIVTIDVPNIEVSEGVRLSQISLLPSFGAGREDEEGYLFLPDGSGSIIRLGTTAFGQTRVDLQVYGFDFGLFYETFGDLPPHAAFPVFGTRVGDTAVFGIIETGEAMAGITAAAIEPNYRFARVHPNFRFFIRDYLNQTANIHTFTSVFPGDVITVRYKFLYGEDASYSGMARFYRQYLVETGMLTRRESAPDAHLNLRMVGGINKITSFLGFPVNSIVPATTFEQAEGIISELHDAGIRSMDVIFTDASNNAREYRSAARINILNQLGGINGYNALISHANDLGFNVFTFADFGKVYRRGHGVTRAAHSIRRMSHDSAVLFDGIFPRGTPVPTFIHPDRFDLLGGRFLTSFERINSNTVYMPTLGGFLSGSYVYENEITRSESLVLTEQFLRTMSNAGLQIKLDTGNAYVLPFACSLINVNLTSSRQRLEYQTVPFLAMVFRGYVCFSGRPINNSGDYLYSFLRTVESGAGLHYDIMAESPLILLDTRFTDIHAIHVDTWMPSIISRYTALRENFEGMGNIRISSHEHLATDVTQTTYEDGTRVIVNFTHTVFEEDDIYVEPMNFVVIRP